MKEKVQVATPREKERREKRVPRAALPRAPQDPFSQHNNYAAYQRCSDGPQKGGLSRGQGEEVFKKEGGIRKRKKRLFLSRRTKKRCGKSA